MKSARTLILIIDDFDRMKSDSQALIAEMLLEVSENKKFILTSQVLLDAKDILPKIEAVIRFKRDTAEMLFSKMNVLNDTD